MATQPEKELTDDEQFALAIKGSQAFDQPAEPEPEPEPAPESPEPSAQAADPAEPVAAQTTEAEAGDAGDGEPGQEAAPAQPAEPFPGYAALTPETREAVDRLRAEREKYQNDYKALHGMTAPLQRNIAYMQRQHDAQVARIQQLEELERKQQNVSAAKDKAIQGYEEWAKQFPEESQAVLAMVNPLMEKVTALEGSLNATQAELGTLRTERQQAALAREVGELEQAHPDWRDVHDNPEYWDWLQHQTPGIQGLNSSMFAGDTIQLLNMFKSTRAPASTPTQASKPSGTADEVQQRRTQNLVRGTQPNVRQVESQVRGGSREALSDEDAQFASLVAGNPNFR